MSVSDLSDCSLLKDQEFAPSSVAIVGHSMGGLVARALLTLKNFKPELINLLITQATPHIAPVMPLDKYLTGEYCTCLIPLYFFVDPFQLYGEILGNQQQNVLLYLL